MAAKGFKVWHLLENEVLRDNPHLAAASIGGGVLLSLGLIYALKTPLVGAQSSDEKLLFSPKFGVRNIFEGIGDFVQNTASEVIGPSYPSFLPLLIFIFMWTLLNNLIGLIPFLGSATDNLNTTLAMGIAVFFYYNIVGFRIHKARYLEHFSGHLKGLLLLFLGPALFVIEVISHMIRPITLGVRLRSNIYGDHMVLQLILGLVESFKAFLSRNLGALGSFLGDLFHVLAPLPFLLLGILIALIQAFVFTLLTMIYIGMAASHEEEH